MLPNFSIMQGKGNIFVHNKQQNLYDEMVNFCECHSSPSNSVGISICSLKYA